VVVDWSSRKREEIKRCHKRSFTSVKSGISINTIPQEESVLGAREVTPILSNK
jgi:hypothetical protein